MRVQTPALSRPTTSGRPFELGQSGNPAGRPLGARHRLSTAFLEALREDFEANGKAAIVAARVADPVAYTRVIASLVPKELEVTGQDGAPLNLRDLPTETLLLMLADVKAPIPNSRRQLE